MFTVFDPLCDGLRDPRGVVGNVCLSWRLGSDRVGTHQMSYRVVVVSMTTGDVVWDTGVVSSGDNWAHYKGATQDKGETCSWFVTVTDDNRNVAHSVPAAFVWGAPGDTATSDLGSQRKGCIWTSDEDLNVSLEDLDGCDIDDPLWVHDLGVSISGDEIRIAPRDSNRFSFIQGSLLVSRGLLIVRMERSEKGLRLEASLPPGMWGELCLGDERRLVESGRHVLCGVRRG